MYFKSAVANFAAYPQQNPQQLLIYLGFSVPQCGLYTFYTHILPVKNAFLVKTNAFWLCFETRQNYEKTAKIKKKS